MDKVQHPSNNGVLGAPPGMTIEQCTALPITRIAYTNQDDPSAPPLPGVRSYWKPSQEEITKLQAGGYVCLEVLGVTMPPTILTVSD